LVAALAFLLLALIFLAWKMQSGDEVVAPAAAPAAAAATAAATATATATATLAAPADATASASASAAPLASMEPAPTASVAVVDEAPFDEPVLELDASAPRVVSRPVHKRTFPAAQPALMPRKAPPNPYAPAPK
jgi:hypothetical protein